MNHLIITFNVGSSSLKAAGYQQQQMIFALNADLKRQQTRWQGEVLLPNWHPHGELADEACAVVDAVMQRYPHQKVVLAHRVVHGGERSQPVIINEAVLQDLEQLAPLCPLHQPPALAVISALKQRWPQLIQVAAFDTAFHAQQPALSRAYALPRHLRQAGIQRYGFHGLSCQAIMQQLAASSRQQGRIIIAHLGSGASITAVKDGISQATSMGFSALDGVPMATRCGHLDVGVVLYLLSQGWTAESLTQLFYQQSGLLGLSGLSSDMRDLISSQQPHAQFAIAYFVEQVARTIAAMATAIAGVDRLVFTGGIGEHQADIRAAIVSHLSWLRLTINSEENQKHSLVISADNSAVEILRLETDEQGQLYQAAQKLLAIRNEKALTDTSQSVVVL